MPSSNSSDQAVAAAAVGGPMQQTEKPEHYRYLKEFRVEQCQLFPLHKCLLHRPFLCFNWHFPNQRRRRPVRRRDGTFNYSADLYCGKYDEGAGVCPDGDDCPLLHRTAGDTERRYHLRYYKTCMCVYETDSKGCCLKNGAHCAFAHGEADRRPAVYDVREAGQPDPDLIDSLCSQLSSSLPPLQPTPPTESKHLLLEDPRWQDANYVLIFYKTDPCRRPPRNCRQGYACPHYHNQRDRRRSPQHHKYRSTPCPSVKHGDEWGEPGACEEGEDCSYCHTRTEQQFHPEIYKSSKCHDVFSLNFCPRGPFCAFAHVESEMALNRAFPLDKSTFNEIAGLPSLPTSDPIDIFKPGQPPPTSSTVTMPNPMLSYSSAVGGGGQKGSTAVEKSHSFMNGILTYEESMRRRSESGSKAEEDCYWLFPNNNSGGGQQGRAHELSPTASTLANSNLLFLDEDDCFQSRRIEPPPVGQLNIFSTNGQLRSDILYLPLPTLNQALVSMRQQLEVVEQAIQLHGGGECSCLVCKDRYRSHILLPCQHQVVCSSCTPSNCPVCSSPVGGRRHHTLVSNNGVGGQGARLFE